MLQQACESNPAKPNGDDLHVQCTTGPELMTKVILAACPQVGVRHLGLVLQDAAAGQPHLWSAHQRHRSGGWRVLGCWVLGAGWVVDGGQRYACSSGMTRRGSARRGVTALALALVTANDACKAPFASVPPSCPLFFRSSLPY